MRGILQSRMKYLQAGTRDFPGDHLAKLIRASTAVYWGQITPFQKLFV